MKTCPWCRTNDSFWQFPSESAKCLHLFEELLPEYLNCCEIASGGFPVVPHALQVELPWKDFAKYTNNEPRPPVQYRLDKVDLANGIGLDLPFKDATFARLVNSHFVEDIPPQFTEYALREWARVLIPTGIMIILHPSKSIFNWCVQNLGQCQNVAHRNEMEPGELGAIAEKIGLIVIRDSLAETCEHDYNILSIFQKPEINPTAPPLDSSTPTVARLDRTMEKWKS